MVLGTVIMTFREDGNARGFYKAKKGGFLFTISSSKNGFLYYVEAQNLADIQRPKAMFFIQCCGRRLPNIGNE